MYLDRGQQMEKATIRIRRVGERLVYTNECRFTGSSVACFVFKKLADEDRPHMLAIGKDQLVSWTNWFKEIGPERDARGDK
jgi:hypothetical protein